MRIVFICLLITFSILLTAGAFAQEEKDSADVEPDAEKSENAGEVRPGTSENETADADFYEKAVIVTAERSPEKIGDSARAVSVVDGREILERIARTVPEALRFEEGVLIQRTNLGGGAPFLRGMVGNQVLYMVDGIRLNNAIYRGGPNQYLNTIDPFFVDQVEIVRGPGSVLYGSDAMGGTINVLTHRREDYSKDGGTNGRIMGRASTAEKEQTAHLGMEANAKTYFGITLSGNYRKFDDVDPGGKEPLQEPYGYEEQNLAANLDFNFGEHVIWQLSGHFVNLDNVPNYDPSNPSNVFEPQRRNLYYTKIHLNDLSENLDRIVLFGAYHRQREGREKIKSSSPDLETRDLDIVNTFSGGLQLESPIGPWVRFILGSEIYDDYVSSSREVENLPSGQIREVDGQFPDLSTYTTAAGYMEARLTPLHAVDNFGLKLVPGVRYTYIKPNIVMKDIDLGDVEINEPIEDVTWAFHNLFSFEKYHGIILGISRGFRAPGIDDLAKFGYEDGRYDVPNDQLEAEKMIQYELGYRVTHPNIFMQLFGYYSEIEDLIVRKEANYNGQSEIDGNQVYRNDNIGEAFICGGEFAIKFQISDELFSSGATMSYTYGENVTDEEPLRRIPPFMGTVYARIKYHPIWIEWAMEAAAEQDRLSEGDIDDSRIGPEGTEGFDIHHIRMGIRPVKWVEVNLAVENLTDERCKYHGSGLFEAGRNYKMQASFIW